MNKGKFTFTQLEKKYGNFIAPAFEIIIGSNKLDSAKLPMSTLKVEIDSGESAGGCTFSIEAQYNYETAQWADGLLDKLAVGAKIIVRAGYVTKKEVFFGYVDDFTIEYSSDSAPKLVVGGIDAKGFLTNSEGRESMKKLTTAEIVKKLLGECVSKGVAKSTTVGTIGKFNAELIQSDVDDFKFLTYLAEKLGVSFFVVDGEIIFDNVMDYDKPLIELTLGVSLMSFTRRLSGAKQVGTVRVNGIDPTTKKQIKGEASSTTLPGGGKVAPIFKSIVFETDDQLAQTEEECKRLAQAEFNRRALEMVSGEGRCVGLPELIPGRYIKISGLGRSDPLLYFITKVTHEFSDDGYYTSFEVKGAEG